ncbi:MAG: hypothetical protein M1531_11510 [Chloroflexi bacterium]|nr:hypothetical protein [Chloroflexota bacterium]
METARLLSGFPVNIELTEVWRWLGSHGRKGDPRLAGEVEEAVALAGELIEPKAAYSRLRVRAVDPSGVLLENGERLNGSAGPYLAEQFRGAEELVVVVVTIGPRLEGRVQDLFGEKRPLEAVILDATGSAASSAASRYVNGLLCEEAGNDGLRAGRIVRPGSSHWDILGQRTLFAMLPTEEIGVSLTTSCLILPRKSGSGVVPLGRHLAAEHEPSEASCRHCPNTRCIARIVDIEQPSTATGTVVKVQATQ